MASRWADSAEDAAEDARRKSEKAEKKRLKAEKQRQAGEEAAAKHATNGHEYDNERPTKRRRLSQHGVHVPPTHEAERKLLRFNAPSWQPCRSVERFDRLNHIEEGSYGFVSRAREEATGEIVAIKKLKLDVVRDGGFPVTALREIQCLRAARHRHVVDLREVVVGDSETRDVYLVMEFLEHDLKTLQEEMEEPFLPSEVKTLLLQLGSAVEFLHDHWILHRDLKTSNILMNNQGEIKVADFGMARFCGDPAPANLTQLVVTLWYRSPELLLGTTTYDSAVDMWSIGCILGELFTKKPLLQGKNEVDQLSKVSRASSPQGLERTDAIYVCLFVDVCTDFRALRDTYRRHLAWVQTASKRPIFTTAFEQQRRPGLDCAIEIPDAHQCWSETNEQLTFAGSVQEALCERNAAGSVLPTGPTTKAYGHVSYVPLEGWTGEETTTGESKCAYERCRARIAGRGGFQFDFQGEEGRGAGWGFSVEVGLGIVLVRPCFRDPMRRSTLSDFFFMHAPFHP